MPRAPWTGSRSEPAVWGRGSGRGGAKGTAGMAYRFLLEVPTSLAAAANVTVESVGDAQVLLVRDSHGLGIDEPNVDLTIAAHSLTVIDAIYDWFDALGASRPDLRLVLHSGERLSLEANNRGAMVAAIRRDQPWVERSIPKVGEHELDAFFLGDDAESALVAARDREQMARGTVAVALPETPRRVAIRHLNYVGIQVNDVAKAERFYRDFLDMEVVARGRRLPGGEMEVLSAADATESVVITGTEPVTSLVRNGPVTLALQHAGRGARLERGLMERIAITVDATTFANLKGAALVRPMTILATSNTSFTFLDPYGVIWEVSVSGQHAWPPA